MSAAPMGSGIPEHERQVLEARARSLARPLRAPTADSAGDDAVTFMLARERYAVDARYVFAVFRLAQLLRIPSALPPVIGVTRWRGDVLTLLDVRSLVGAPAGGLDDLAVVIVLGQGAPEFGLLADALGATIKLTQDALHPLQDRRAADLPNLVRGVTTDAHLVLDAPLLIARQTADAAPSDPSPAQP